MQIGASRLKNDIIPNVLRGKIGSFHLRSINTKRGIRLRLDHTEQDASITLEDRRHRQRAANFLIDIASAYDKKILVACDVRKDEGQRQYRVSYTVRGDDR